MCLYTKRGKGTEDRRKKQELLIATQDILVYKRLNEDLHSKVLKLPHRSTVFNPNGMKASLGITTRYARGEGRYFEVNEGLHAYTSKKHAGRSSTNVKVFKAVVPQGSQYMLSIDNSEIVATEMKLYVKQVVPKQLTF